MQWEGGRIGVGKTENGFLAMRVNRSQQTDVRLRSKRSHWRGRQECRLDVEAMQEKSFTCKGLASLCSAPERYRRGNLRNNPRRVSRCQSSADSTTNRAVQYRRSLPSLIVGRLRSLVTSSRDATLAKTLCITNNSLRLPDVGFGKESSHLRSHRRFCWAWFHSFRLDGIHWKDPDTASWSSIPPRPMGERSWMLQASKEKSNPFDRQREEPIGSDRWNDDG